MVKESKKEGQRSINDQKSMLAPKDEHPTWDVHFIENNYQNVRSFFILAKLYHKKQ